MGPLSLSFQQATPKKVADLRAGEVPAGPAHPRAWPTQPWHGVRDSWVAGAV